MAHQYMPEIFHGPPKKTLRHSLLHTAFPKLLQINQVTSKCQMDFLDKTCRSETEKMKLSIEFCIYELVYNHLQKILKKLSKLR